MELSGLCMGCMQEKGNAFLCPHCGRPELAIAADDVQYLPPRRLLAERYLLGRVLGQGRYGITYIAWDCELEVRIAVKEWFPQDLVSRSADTGAVNVDDPDNQDLYDSGKSQFLEEAAALARFRGDRGIVQVAGGFEANETAYMVMEYIEGMSFEDYISQKGLRISYAEALPFVIQAAASLEKLHTEGVLHLDVSTENIYLTVDGRVVLTDFGETRYEIKENIKSRSVQKRRKYGLEEKVRRKAARGPWVDVYNLGAVFYRAITGCKPQPYRERLEHDTLVAPSYLGVGLPPEVEQIIIRAMSLNAGERYADMTAFRYALLESESSATRIIEETESGQSEESPAGPRPWEAEYQPSVTRVIDIDYTPDETYLDPQAPIKLPAEPGGSAPWFSRLSRKSRMTLGLMLFAVLIVLPAAASIWGYATGNSIMDMVFGPPIEDTGTQGDGSQLVEDDPLELTVAGDWVYFVNNSDGTKLYRVGLDGSGRQKLNDDRTVNIVVAGDWAYYVNNSDDMKLYRVKIDGSERQKLNDSYSAHIVVSGEWVYYTNVQDDMAMYRVKADGTELQKLYSGCSYCISVVGDWIFFNWINFQNVNDTGLYRLKTDGSEIFRIGVGLASYANITPDWIYYNNKSDGYRLYRMKHDGTGVQKLNDDESLNINVIWDWIYYVNQSDGMKIYRIKTDGSGRQKIGDDKAVNMIVAGDWLYYRKDTESGSLYRMMPDGSDIQLLVK